MATSFDGEINNYLLTSIDNYATQLIQRYHVRKEEQLKRKNTLLRLHITCIYIFGFVVVGILLLVFLAHAVASDIEPRKYGTQIRR